MNEFASPTATTNNGQFNSSGGSNQFVQNSNLLPHQGRYSKPKYDQSLRLQAMQQPIQPRKPGATVIQNATSINTIEPSTNEVASMYGSPQKDRFISSSPPGKQPIVMHPTPQNISISRDHQHQASLGSKHIAAPAFNNVQLSNQISQRSGGNNQEAKQYNQHPYQQHQQQQNSGNSAQGSSREYIILDQTINNEQQPKHSILSTNGLMSLSSKIDAAKIKGAQQQQPTLVKATSSSQLSQMHAPGGGGYMLPQQQHENIKLNMSNGKHRQKQLEHPMLRKPGVYISSIQQINNPGSPGPQDGGLQSSNNTGGTVSSQQTNNNMFGSSQGFSSFPGISNNTSNNITNNISNLLNLSDIGNSSTNDPMQKSMEGGNQGPKQKSQHKFMIQPTFMNVVGGGNPQIMGPPPPIQLSNNPDEMTRNIMDAAELRQILMANRPYRPSMGQGGLQQSSTTVNQSIKANGMQQMINAKNDFIFNYLMPQQQQVNAAQSYQSAQNKSNNAAVRMSGVSNNRPSMYGNQSMSESPPPLKPNGQQQQMYSGQIPYQPQLSQSVGPPPNRSQNNHHIFNNFQSGTGGHLFTYNEIRDHKKNLMNSLKRKGALNGGIIPNRLGGGQQPQQTGNDGGGFLPEVNWATNSNATTNGVSDSSIKDKPQWDAFIGQDNTLNELGKQFFVNSALVIQNFVFNLPGAEQQKNGIKLQGNQINFSKLTPIQQQQYLLQLQQQLNQQSQLNSLMNHYSQIGSTNNNQNNNRNQPGFSNPAPFGSNGNNQHFTHDQQQNFDIPFVNPARNYMGGGVRVPQLHKKYQGGELQQDMIMYTPTNNQGSQLADRSDTVLKIMMQNDYREKLKQIYAQTGKILEETLKNNNQEAQHQQPLTQEQLFQMRGNYQYNNNLNLSDLLMPLLGQDDANYQQQLYGLDEETLKYIVDMQQQIIMNQQLQNGNSSFDRRRHGSATNNEGEITPDLSPKGNLPDLIITQAQVRRTSLKRAGAIQIGNRGKAKHILKKQGSHNVKQKRGEDGQLVDIATEDNNMIDDSCVPAVIAYDSSPGMAGRNPSSMRKQYCNSQQTMDRQINRKGSGTELNATGIPATERNEQADSTIKQASIIQRPNFNYRRVQASLQSKNQTQTTTNKPQTTQGVTGNNSNSINQQRNQMSHSKSKNDLQNKPDQLALALPEKTEKIAEQDEENEADKDPNSTTNAAGDQSANVQLVQQPYIRPPPKRIVNPYDEFLKEQEKIQQARKEAKQKYTKISATQNQYRAPLKFIIREGNNHQIIQKIMNLRINNFGLSENTLWEETPNYDSLFNFKWQPTSYGMKYDQISTYGLKQLVNHIEGHESITTKDQIFINLKAYCEKTPCLNVFDLVPLTFILDFKSEQIYEQFEVFKSVHKLIDANISQDVNELNKKLASLQCAMERRTMAQIKNPYKMMQTAHDHKNIWLLKPTGLNRGRGIHIFTTVDELRQILIDNYDINWINSNAVSVTSTSKRTSDAQPSQTAVNTTAANTDDQLNISNVTPIEQVNTVNTTTPVQQQTEKGAATIEKQSKLRSFSFVIQKYIEKPMLFKKRKFDIRVWVLLSFDFRCYLFRECYVRTSCEDYDLGQDNLDKIYVHLTNNAIQKFSDNYGKFEDGNQISLQELSDNLATQESAKGLSGDEIKAKIEIQHKDLIIHSLKAIKGKLKIRKYTYELVGYDFIIDEDLQSYIIEVNTNPCIEESSQLLKALVPRMLDDMFRLTLDQVFSQNGVIQQPPGQGLVQPPPNNPASRFSVPGYDDTMNMFEHIYSFS